MLNVPTTILMIKQSSQGYLSWHLGAGQSQWKSLSPRYLQHNHIVPFATSYSSRDQHQQPSLTTSIEYPPMDSAVSVKAVPKCSLFFLVHFCHQKPGEAKDRVEESLNTFIPCVLSLIIPVSPSPRPVCHHLLPPSLGSCGIVLLCPKQSQ